ncbi:MAG: Cthe_2314 family HEPN domain-containing protein [Candidatus Paceibacterota bacterium]|jgi:hypothetical protein
MENTEKQNVKSSSRPRSLYIQEIPAKYFPKNTKSKEYKTELIRMMNNLRYTNEKIQYSAQICIFNITSITRKKGFHPSIAESFRLLEEFVYHYENFCFRIFAFREKILKFINAILPVGFEKDKDVKIQFMMVNPVVKNAGLLPIIQEFAGKKNLKKLIEDRHSLTHMLYYGKEFDHYLRPKNIEPKNEQEFKQWCINWKAEVVNRAKLAQSSMNIISKMNMDLANRVVRYKNSIKK